MLSGLPAASPPGPLQSDPHGACGDATPQGVGELVAQKEGRALGGPSGGGVGGGVCPVPAPEAGPAARTHPWARCPGFPAWSSHCERPHSSHLLPSGLMAAAHMAQHWHRPGREQRGGQQGRSTEAGWGVWAAARGQLQLLKDQLVRGSPQPGAFLGTAAPPPLHPWPWTGAPPRVCSCLP